MKFMRPTAGHILLDCRRDENILEKLKVDPMLNKLAQYKQKCYIMSAGWKTFDTQNNSLTIDLSKDKDLDDR
jgi:hypothetical protein